MIWHLSHSCQHYNFLFIWLAMYKTIFSSHASVKRAKYIFFYHYLKNDIVT